MGRYKVDKSTGNLTSLDSPMIGASAAVPGAGGDVPAPAAGDQNNFLKGDGTWDDPNNNYVGIIRQWSALSLEEKKKYKTADIIKGYAIRYYPNGGTGNIVQDEKGISEVYIIPDNEYTNFTPPGPVVDTEYTIDPEDSGHRYKKLFGYGLNHWNTESNDSGTDYNPGDQYLMNASLGLYSQWELTQQVVGIADEQYLLTLVPDNGVDTITVEVESTAIPPVSGTTTYWINEGDRPVISVTPKAGFEWAEPFAPAPMDSSATYDIETEPVALKFSSDEPFTLSVANPGWVAVSNPGCIEYTIDKGENWLTWLGNRLSGDKLQPIYLRGKNNSVITGNNTITNKEWIFTGKYCTGNIETLLDYQTVINGQPPTMADYCYRGMFKNCTSLITAPSLPATTLTKYCYQEMFRGCSALTVVPALPATILKENCYGGMFSDCISLTNAPQLPATTLAERCYSAMFRSCTALTTAPELSVTTLTYQCYKNMFQGCTSLTTAPSLPATVLSIQCYDNMFLNCTALTVAPELPATTLADDCYAYMFAGCTSLKLSTVQDSTTYKYAYRIPTNNTGTTASSALDDMFTGTGGTFTGTPTINTTYYTDHQPV